MEFRKKTQFHNEQLLCARFELTLNITGSWFVIYCSLFEIYRRFGETLVPTSIVDPKDKGGIFLRNFLKLYARYGLSHPTDRLYIGTY